MSLETLTTQQLIAIRNHMNANATAIPFINTGQYQAVADLYNVLASPDFWVWRLSVSRAEIYHQVSPDGTSWNWTTYKNQGATEQNAWVQMFMSDVANFSLPNLRAGVAAIFTGSAQATAQRDHILSCARRKATLAESIVATGTGSAAVPATITEDLMLDFAQVEKILITQG